MVAINLDKHILWLASVNIYKILKKSMPWGVLHKNLCKNT